MFASDIEVLYVISKLDADAGMRPQTSVLGSRTYSMWVFVVGQEDVDLLYKVARSDLCGYPCRFHML
jgi:hypothetical protein